MSKDKGKGRDLPTHVTLKDAIDSQVARIEAMRNQVSTIPKQSRYTSLVMTSLEVCNIYLGKLKVILKDNPEIGRHADNLYSDDLLKIRAAIQGVNTNDFKHNFTKALKREKHYFVKAYVMKIQELLSSNDFLVSTDTAEDRRVDKWQLECIIAKIYRCLVEAEEFSLKIDNLVVPSGGD